MISSSFTTSISDHLSQFAVIPNMFGNISGNKCNIYERDWSKLDRKKIILDYFSVDGDYSLKIDKLNADNLTTIYLDKINIVRYLSADLKINKYKLKVKRKPWITLKINICEKQCT